MQPHHVTLRDPSLPHQVVFATSHEGPSDPITVSCNCRRVLHHTTHVCEPMGVSPNLDVARQLYNDPSNHRAAFDPVADAARW